MTRRALPILAAVLAAALALAACGDDDGGDVRSLGGEGSESGTASGSPSGASGSPSGASGSPSGSPSATGECVPVGDPDDADETVEVVLDEWSIEATPAEVPAGTIHFVVDNPGEEPHEVAIVRGDDPDALPLDDHGALDEAGLAAGDLVGEVEPFPGGTTCHGTFDLEAGDYLLVCNVVETEEDGEIEAHLAEGMVTPFTVTA